MARSTRLSREISQCCKWLLIISSIDLIFSIVPIINKREKAAMLSSSSASFSFSSHENAINSSEETRFDSQQYSAWNARMRPFLRDAIAAIYYQDKFLSNI